MPLASMKPRNDIHSPWLPQSGIKKYHIGRKIRMDEIIMVFRMAFEAVAPM